MTYNLYKMFKERYPGKYNKFSIYEANERINVILRDRLLLGKNNLLSLNEIDGVSEKYFEGFYEIKDGKQFQMEGLIVFLNPRDSLSYERYDHHSFWIPRSESSLEIEISTGNRGISLLNQQQRIKYFWFVKSLFDRMKENALKK